MLSPVLDPTARQLQISIEGSAIPHLNQNAPADARPFIHPLLSPDGVGTLTENEPPHHAWQHGLYIGLNDVNGHGFWCEGKHPGKTNDGTFHPSPIRVTSSTADAVAWQFDCLYRGHDGSPLLTEIQSWTYRHLGHSTRLDLVWTLRATVPLRFGQYPYGGLFLRMPYTAECDGEVLTSENATTIAAAEGKRARWVAVSMLIAERMSLAADARRATVVIFDHPTNAEHPVPWRVDDQFGIAPSRCIAGAWSLDADESITFRHRVFTTTGRPDSAIIEASYADFANDFREGNL